MATFSQRAQNENLLIHRGKVGKELKPELPKLTKLAKKPLGKAGERPKPDRKALGDLSNIRKPLASGVPKSSGSTTSTKKSDTLTEQQVKKCQEWAQEGIEKMHFTGNDIQKLERDCMEKRVKEEVATVMSSMNEWGSDTFDLMSPRKDGVGDSGLKLEFEPEILSSRSGKVCNELKPKLSKLTKTAKKASDGLRLKTERKALGDLSNISKPHISSKVRKDLSSVPKSSKSNKSTQESNSLTEEQMKKCQEWAEEDIEHMYFTGNDIQKLERDYMEKRVKEQVAMVMSSVHDWGNDMFDLVSPRKDGVDYSGLKMEFEPEILSPIPDNRRCDKNNLDGLLNEPDSPFPELNFKLELKLKDFSGTN
ncbi:uncharacterized protein LOC144565980 isoform X1 [Carex rostrata]